MEVKNEKKIIYLCFLPFAMIFVFVDSNNPTSVTIHNYIHVLINPPPPTMTDVIFFQYIDFPFWITL